MAKDAATNIHKSQKVALLPRPVRRCAACHERKSAAEMLRFMRAGCSWLWQPPVGHMAGRSLYLCPTTKCLNMYKGKLTSDEPLVDFLVKLETTISDYVEKRCFELKNDHLNGANKASLRLSSTIKILATLRSELPLADRN